MTKTILTVVFCLVATLAQAGAGGPQLKQAIVNGGAVTAGAAGLKQTIIAGGVAKGSADGRELKQTIVTGGVVKSGIAAIIREAGAAQGDQAAD